MNNENRISVAMLDRETIEQMNGYKFTDASWRSYRQSFEWFTCAAAGLANLFFFEFWVGQISLVELINKIISSRGKANEQTLHSE